MSLQRSTSARTDTRSEYAVEREHIAELVGIRCDGRHVYRCGEYMGDTDTDKHYYEHGS